MAMLNKNKILIQDINVLLIETASHTNIAQFQIIRDDKTVTQLCISENMTTSWRNNYTIYFIFHGTLRVITNCKRP